MWYIFWSLQTQAFLKKEFSYENIYFWSACEQYRQLNSVEERRLAARKIVNLHISSAGPYTINIDTAMIQSIHEHLEFAESDLFAESQEHIYKLMRFDSFLRFKKSDLYKESFVAELDGEPLPMDSI